MVFVAALCLALGEVISSSFLFCDTDMSVLSADSRKLRSSLRGALSSTILLRVDTITGLTMIVRASVGCFSPPLNTDNRPECCSCAEIVFERISVISATLEIGYRHGH